MKASVRKSLLVVFSSAILALVCAFACMNMASTKAYAAESFTEPANATVVAKDAGFAVIDGAGVRVTTAGIKFQTTVTKAFHEGIADGATSVKYFAVAKKVGGAAQKIDFAATPDFTEDEIHEYNTYLNFDAYQSANKDDLAKLAAAYATEFEVETYAEVVKGATTTYYKAYQADDNSRSMRVVANAAQLNGEDAAALAQYFTAQDRSAEQVAYVDANGNGNVTLPEGETYVGAYFGTKNVTDAISGNVITLTGIDSSEMIPSRSTTYDISAFTSTGKVVSRKLVYAQRVITADNFATAMQETLAKDATYTYDGNYTVLAEDIDMSGMGTWASTASFEGSFNGLGHTISNMTTSTGLFSSFNGFFRNLNMVNFASTGNSGIVAKTYNRNGLGTYFENMFVSATHGGDWYTCILGSANMGSSVSFNNIVLVNQGKAGVGLYGYDNGSTEVARYNATNCYLIAADEGLSTGDLGTSVKYANGGELAMALANDQVTGITSSAKAQAQAYADAYAKANNIYFIDSTNVADLLNVTSGTIYITEDIDMATAYTANDGVWVSAAKFTGTFDGMGHTIKNLNTTGNANGLFNTFDGTFKNIALTDVVTTGSTGAVAYSQQRTSALTFSNVAISFKTGNTNYYAAGLYRQLLNLNATTKFENVFIYVPTTGNSGNGYIAGNITYSGTPEVTFDNCYFVGYGKKLNFDGVDLSAKEGYTAYADLAELQAAGLNGDIVDLPDVVSNVVNDVCNFITSKNVAKLLNPVNAATYYITEDIDMATAYTANDGVWESNASWYGVIDGLGHTISNFKTSTGLFKYYRGINGKTAVKDIAFVDAVLTKNGGIMGGYARSGENVAYAMKFENVYASFAKGGNDWYVGLLGEANLNQNVVLVNCVIVGAGATNPAVVGRVGSSKIDMTNCYLVNAKPYGASLHSGDQATLDGLHILATNTAYSFDSVAAMTEGYQGGLADFIEKILGL